MSTNTKTLIINIKRELKRQGINYQDLAYQLNIAESTVKKMFAKGNFSLDRLDQICDALGVELLDMVENVNDEVTRISKLTVQQENALLSDFTLLLVAYAAINFWSLEDILYRYKLERNDVIARLKILEGFGILEVRSNQRIRPLISNNFQWLPDGPLSVFFREHFIPAFFDHDFKEPGSLRVIRYGDLTDQSKVKLDRKCMELVDLYDTLTYQDRHFRPGDRERKSTTMVVAYRTWTIGPWTGIRKG